jgi:hypothetical protein
MVRSSETCDLTFPDKTERRALKADQVHQVLRVPRAIMPLPGRLIAIAVPGEGDLVAPAAKEKTGGPERPAALAVH